jgi:serine protease
MSMSTSLRTRLRHATLALCIIGLVVAPIPAAAAVTSLDATGVFGSDTLTSAALDRPTDAVGYGTGPGWAVKVDQNATNSTGKLEEWASVSDDRRLIDNVSDAGWATVAAPRGHIGTGLPDRLLGGGLASKGYVTAIEPETRVHVQPVDSLRAEEDIAFAELGLVQSLRSSGSLDSVASGVATSNDSAATTMARSRAVTGADNVSVTGAGVTVGVVDTGINTDDGAVFGNGTGGSDLRVLDASKNVLTGETVGADGIEAVADGNGHGTHVASTIAANTSNASFGGMAPDADLLVVKALADDGSGSSADIAAAIRHAADQDVDVLSLSLGAPTYSQQIADAVAYARDEGVVVPIATGNSRQTVRWTATPSDVRLDGVISVGAANVPDNGTGAALPAYFSQMGPDPGTLDLSNGATAGAGVDLVAPGMQVSAKTPTTSNTVRVTTLSGTSMATPHVSGAAALVIASDEGVRGQPAVIEAQLTNATREVPDATLAAGGQGYLAVDRAIAGENASDQAAARTDAAVARDQAWQTVSGGSGGILFDLQRSLGIDTSALGGLPV